MAKPFDKLLKNVSKFAGSVVAFGPIRSAHRVTKELQQQGPSWTGQFSNSWRITTPDGRFYEGDGSTGEPRPINVPSLTFPQAIKTGFSKNKVVFTISNNSRWAGQAVDFLDDDFFRPTKEPQTQLGRSKWEISEVGRSQTSIRGDLIEPVGKVDTGKASRTAPQDWFTTYLTSGKLDKAITVEMNNMLRRL
jgi:hypothetical protein